MSLIKLFKDKAFVVLLLIVFLGLALRVVRLSDTPPSINWDEVSHGYNAYSILKTGRDEWGKLLPLTNFRAYGDYPLPLNLYLTIPFIKFFGLTELSIRLPHAILGTLTIFAVYYLTLGLTNDKRTSLLASFLFAIDPWGLFTARSILQANLSIFFLTSSLAAFFNRDKHRFLLPLSFFFLGLTLFSYHTTRIFSPLLLVVIFLLYWKKIAKPLPLIILAIFFLPLPFILSNSEARARANVVFIIDQGAVNKIIEAREKSSLPVFVKRVFYNRPVYFAQKFLTNYLDYFSPGFLFLRGGTQYQFSIPGRGLSYLINLPFFYLGLILLVKKFASGKKDYSLILGWLLLAPIPASITQERFAVLRASTMIPLIEILIAVGALYVWDKFGKRFSFTSIIYLIFLALSLGRYLDVYFGSYRTDYSWAWQYGYKEVVDYAKSQYGNYDKIIVTKKYGEPHEFFLFFWPWNPDKYRSDPNLIRFAQSDWFWVDRFDKFYFINDWEIPKKKGVFVLESKKEVVDCTGKIKCLLITSPGNFPDGWVNLKIVNFLDDKPAFEIYEN